MAHTSTDTVRLLLNAVDGDECAQADLFAHLYAELKYIARLERYHWHGDYTMSATAILHEAYLRLTKGAKLNVTDRSHFLAVAGKAMRQILVDYARSKKAQKRGGELRRVSLDDVVEGRFAMNSSNVLDITEAMEHLERSYPQLAAIVECRFYSGMTIDETACEMGIGTSTVKRRWAMAQSLLYDHINGEP